MKSKLSKKALSYVCAADTRLMRKHSIFKPLRGCHESQDVLRLRLGWGGRDSVPRCVLRDHLCCAPLAHLATPTDVPLFHVNEHKDLQQVIDDVVNVRFC